METKRCNKCDKFKPLDEFHKNPNTRDGRQTACKECRIGPKKKERLSLMAGGLYRCTVCQEIKPSAEFTVNKQLSQGHAPRCKECCNTINREKRAEAGKRRVALPKNAKRSQYTREWYRKRPKVKKAHNAISTAVASGRLPSAPSLLCHECGNQAAQYHHYLGYEIEHWFDVIPLCYKCHRVTQSNSARK